MNELNAKTSFSVYPNPAKDVVIIQTAKSISGVKIYSTSGALVKNIAKVSENKINVSDLATGVYIVKINDSAESIKLIKK
jgi:hypothetical protein